MSPQSRPAGLAAMLLLAACSEQPAQQPTLVSTEQHIHHGSADTTQAHQAVIALGTTSRVYFCSGTLIAPRVVLTAAHCTWGKRAEDLLIGFGSSVDDPDFVWVPVNEVWNHPQFDMDYLTRDLSLLRLASPAPEGVKPIPALPPSLALDRQDVGSAVEFVGFGVTETGSRGTKMAVSEQIDCVCDGAQMCDCLGLGFQVNPYTFCYDHSPGGPCSGDSGGPAFVTVDGREYLAGATSYGDVWCVEYGCSTKVDRYHALIESFVGEVGTGPDGVACLSGSDCESGSCADGVCCNGRCDGGGCDACSVAAGASADGVCTPLAGGCDDGDLCTTGDACVEGRCAGRLVACAAPDGCHEASVCDPATGGCLPPAAKTDGAACSDLDDCTVDDACRQGVCVGSPRTVCESVNPCKESAVCVDGACGEFPNKPDGTACDDGNPCSREDACSDGVCRSGTPVTCPAPSPCHYASSCSPATGECLPNAEKPEGAACSDGKACTTGERCVAGVCLGEVTETTCEAPDDCHVGLCDAQTGDCRLEPVADGAACDDGDPCTGDDTCRAGVCSSGEALCTPPGPCQVVAGCDAASGGCRFAPAADGAACDDADPCTGGDACSAGECVGTEVSCEPPDECRAAGTCDAAGGCVYPPLADGTACSLGTCRAGVCVAGEPEGDAAGCGCGAGGGAGPASLLFALLSLVVPRRRAQRR